eukprot:5761401-Amphidinium_carterae.1
MPGGRVWVECELHSMQLPLQALRDWLPLTLLLQQPFVNMPICTTLGIRDEMPDDISRQRAPNSAP